MTVNTLQPSTTNDLIGINKNVIVNGAFDFWQRGTTRITGSMKAADTWYVTYSNAPTTHSVNAVQFLPGNAPVPGYEGSYYFNRKITTVGSSTDEYLGTYIEDARTLAGQVVTFSFWAKADSARTISIAFNQVLDSTNGGSSNQVGNGSSWTLSTTWTRYSATFTLPSLAGKTLGQYSYLNPYFSYTPASGLEINLWGVQLEAGPNATTFSRCGVTKFKEQQLCQRYYVRWASDTLPITQGTDGVAGPGALIGTNALVAIGYQSSSSQQTFFYHHPVPTARPYMSDAAFGNGYNPAGGYGNSLATSYLNLGSYSNDTSTTSTSRITRWYYGVNLDGVVSSAVLNTPCYLKLNTSQSFAFLVWDL